MWLLPVMAWKITGRILSPSSSPLLHQFPQSPIPHKPIDSSSDHLRGGMLIIFIPKKKLWDERNCLKNKCRCVTLLRLKTNWPYLPQEKKSFSEWII